MSATAKAVLVVGRLLRKLILILPGGLFYGVAHFDNFICIAPSCDHYWLSRTISQCVAFTKLWRS